MVGGGAHVGQAQGEVHRRLGFQDLDGDQPLVVVERHHQVELAAPGPQEDGVGGVRSGERRRVPGRRGPARIQIPARGGRARREGGGHVGPGALTARGLRPGQGALQDLFLAPEGAAFARVGVQGAQGDPQPGTARQLPEAVRGEGEGLGHRAFVQFVDDRTQALVHGVEHHAQPRAGEGHAGDGRPRQGLEEFRVARNGEPRGVGRGLGKGQGHQGVAQARLHPQGAGPDSFHRGASRGGAALAQGEARRPDVRGGVDPGNPASAGDQVVAVPGEGHGAPGQQVHPGAGPGHHDGGARGQLRQGAEQELRADPTGIAERDHDAGTRHVQS